MIRLVPIASVCLLACACSAADPTSDDAFQSASDSDGQEFDSSAAEPGLASSEVLLNNVRFENLELSFIWSGDVASQEGSLAISESFGTDYVGALREQYGPLTSLELFNAFAPAGAEPHALLVARHEGEARAYGRSGDGLAVLDVDVRTLNIDKSVPANCQSQILPNISPGSYTEIQSTDAGVDGRYVFTCTGAPKVSGIKDVPNAALGCEMHFASKELTVGLCTDSVNTGHTAFYTSQFNPIHGTTATWRGDVAKNTVRRFTLTPDGFPLAPNRSLAVLGRNSTNDVNNFHVQKTGVGVYP